MKHVVVRVAVPLSWYVAVTLGVPLLSGHGARADLRFRQHAETVLAVVLTAAVGIAFAELRARSAVRRGGSTRSSHP